MNKIIASILILLILVSSFGLTFSTHYCGGHALDTKISLAEQDVDCGMEMSKTDCEDQMMDEDNCCENSYFTVELDDEFKVHSESNFLSNNQIIAFLISFSHLNEPVSNIIQRFIHDDPPLPERTIQILYQQFLI